MAQETLEWKSEQPQPETGDAIITVPVNHGLRASWGATVGRVMPSQISSVLPSIEKGAVQI